MQIPSPTWPDAGQIEIELAKISAAALAPLTRSSYASDLRVFTRWLAGIR